MTDIVESVEHENQLESLIKDTNSRLEAIIYLLEVIADQDVNTTLEDFT